MSEQVSTNARQINILSITATIEAALAGKYGDGFSVVAKEVRELSTASDEVGKRISALVEDFNTAMSSVIEITEKNAEQDEQSMVTSEATIRSVMQRFQGVTSRLADSAADMRETGTRIQGEISDMLVSLQFQDRVSQILENVTTHMSRLHGRIEHCLSLQDERAMAAELENLEGWLRSMEETYTTAEQRSAHQGLDNQAQAQSSVAFF